MDPHDSFAERFAFVHGRLLFALDRLIASVDDPRVTELVPLYVSFLEGHHHAEEHVLFPALRAAGRLRSSDAAFLDARTNEHRDVARLVHAVSDEGLAHASELRALLGSHFAVEEDGLTAAHLREMIDAVDIPRPNGDASVVNRLFEHPLLAR